MSVKEKLKKIKNDKYKEFSSRLVFTKYEILGVTIPNIKKIALSFAENEKYAYLNSSLNNKTFEEIMLYGFTLSTLKSYDIFFRYLDKFLPFIDNWSVCDSCVSSFKIIKSNQDKFLPFIDNLLSSNEPFYIRVALVSLLRFYMEEKYLSYVFTKINAIKNDNYYVSMAISWLLSEYFIKFKSQTIDFLLNANLNDFIVNKTVSKIRDSLRVSKEDKDFVLTLKANY